MKVFQENDEKYIFFTEFFYEERGYKKILEEETKNKSL